MHVSDALPLLENLGLKVKFNKVGIVKKQSLLKGTKIRVDQVIELKA